ncbi:MAG TPA: histidine kinase dimerization/phospho-acceptor domain-containing protein [Burkholderiaceae bacterium]|nr:histidine kinase dimerization/phospho-acceptor domain-containing protein [Burkholderiaceae bacterium]
MKQPTLMQHLLAWVLGALVLVWASFIVLGYRTGVHEADELTDGHLASVASLLLSQRDAMFVLPREPLRAGLPSMQGHDYQQSLSIVVWDAAGQVLTWSGNAPRPPFFTSAGFADLQLGDPPEAWRTFAQWDGPQHTRRVMVLLNLQERDDLARDIAEQMAMPGLWLLPAIALVLGFAIRRGLQPLHALSRAVRELDATQSTVLPSPHPQREFKAVVDSINTLLQRQHAALSRERQVAGELAHELRTPLASLALHARSLRGAVSNDQRDASLARLEQDALRAGEVLTHLLALARASRTELAEAAQALDLAELARRVVGEYAQAALDSGHELAFSGPASHAVNGHAVLLELALRNLIENALRHTPRGTTVEVQIDAAHRWVQVCDNGSHAAADPPQARTPPALGLGLGLGHRVIEKIAAIHKAHLALVPPPAGFDTCYRITFEPG